jgi:hypothetical protein
METETLTIQEIGKAAERALEYQRYIFRRTYGVYYLVWAAAMVLLGSTSVSAVFGLSGDLGAGVELSVNVIVLAAAVGATALIFRDARRTLGLRRALGRRRRRGGYARYFVGWVVGMYVVIFAVDLLVPAYSYAVVYAALLPVPFVIYFMLGIAFPQGRPAEGLIALTTYGAAVTINLVLSLLGIDSWAVGWVWAATAVVWFLASFYALFRAPDELEALS